LGGGVPRRVAPSPVRRAPRRYFPTQQPPRSGYGSVAWRGR
jgi:hypothetical protein